MSQQTGVPTRCPACGEDSLDDSLSSIDPICRSCGIVVTEETPSHIAESLEQDETEGPRTWSEYYKVRNSTEQQIAAAFEELEDVGDRLRLESSERERAAKLYAEAAIETATDGRPASLVIAAVIVHATRLERNRRPLGCIAGFADVEVNSLSRIVSSLPAEVGFDTRTPAPQEYIPWLCSELQINPDSQERAITFVDELADQGRIAGKHPVGIASAAIYMAAGGVRTQRSIANSAGITEETIRVRVADCREAGVVE